MTQHEAEHGQVSMPPACGAVDTRDAVRQLFIDHNAQLLRFLRTRLASDQEARDVAQEAYARLLALEDDRTVSFLRAYLYRIAANIINDRSRRLAVRDAAHADPVFDLEQADECSPEKIVSDRQRLAIVEAALLELPRKVQMTFILHRVEGMRVADAARQLGVSERAARNYILTALVHLKKRLGERVSRRANDVG
jgi:RNA polymerase sigma-70 factor (ECF subfamily)